MRWLVLFPVFLCLSVPAAAPLEAQVAPCQALTSVVVPQRSYAQLSVPDFEQRVYVYAPDIKSSWGGGFSDFTLWIVEGVYGKPFVQATGSMDEQAFEQIRSSRNVMATGVPVDKNPGPKRAPFTIGKQKFVLEVAKVNTSLGGTDSVSVSVCR
jgi:hypothetical protein